MSVKFLLRLSETGEDQRAWDTGVAFLQVRLRSVSLTRILLTSQRLEKERGTFWWILEELDLWAKDGCPGAVGLKCRGWVGGGTTRGAPGRGREPWSGGCDPGSGWRLRGQVKHPGLREPEGLSWGRRGE